MAKANALVNDLRNSLNKQAKHTIAYDLHGENPTEVKTWISTGSTVLDLVISNREDGGIPVGKITTIAGESQSGKSLIATHILANTQKKGGIAIYIDTENASDPGWMVNRVVMIPTHRSVCQHELSPVVYARSQR